MHSYYLEVCILTCGIRSNFDYLAIRRVNLRFISLPQLFVLSNSGAQLL